MASFSASLRLDIADTTGMKRIRRSNPSQGLLQAIKNAESMSAFIRATKWDKLKADSDKERLAGDLCSLVKEHHAAILHLLRAGQFDGSAFALTRPLIDGSYKAQWVICCAKPVTIQRILRGVNCYPSLEPITEEIEGTMYKKASFTLLFPEIHSLRSSAHWLQEQLTLRFGREGDMEPFYSDLERRQLVISATALLTLLSIAWCQLSKTPDKTERCTKLIVKKYIQIFGQQLS